MASSVIAGPLISMRTPVSSGRVSSRDAAIDTWETACDSVEESIAPTSVGCAGSSGYSSRGMTASVKCEDPQTRFTFWPSSSTETGLEGSDLEMSARRRPETRTSPASSTVAGMCEFAETS